jgi:hypothetical protein
LSAYSKAALAKHNELRAKHGAAPLVIDPEIQNVAQAYAELLAPTGELRHSSNNYGENLSMNGYSSVAVTDKFCSGSKFLIKFSCKAIFFSDVILFIFTRFGSKSNAVLVRRDFQLRFRQRWLFHDNWTFHSSGVGRKQTRWIRFGR